MWFSASTIRLMWNDSFGMRFIFIAMHIHVTNSCCRKVSSPLYFVSVLLTSTCSTWDQTMAKALNATWNCCQANATNAHFGPSISGTHMCIKRSKMLSLCHDLMLNRAVLERIVLAFPFRWTHFAPVHHLKHPQWMCVVLEILNIKLHFKSVIISCNNSSFNNNNKTLSEHFFFLSISLLPTQKVCIKTNFLFFLSVSFSLAGKHHVLAYFQRQRKMADIPSDFIHKSMSKCTKTVHAKLYQNGNECLYHLLPSFRWIFFLQSNVLYQDCYTQSQKEGRTKTLRNNNFS